jgi:glycosyltransferase involved in cell wall biosynthesis
MKIAPVPVDIQKYQVCPPPNLRKELGLSSQSVVISSVGQAIYRKAWDVLIKAFAVARVQNPDLRLLLIGPTNGTPEQTEYYGILRKLVDELNVGETVSFLGARQDVPELLSITDIFAFPTRGEGLPGALAEAMAAGLPCVATRVSGNPELILHEATGLLIEVEDADGLTKSLLELVQNPTRRKQLGEAARKSLAQFALEYQVDHTMRLYESQLHRIPRHRID